MLKTDYTRLGGAGFYAINALLILVGVIGYIYILNISEITYTVYSSLTGIFILRCIGIFVIPLGCVLGYF